MADDLLQRLEDVHLSEKDGRLFRRAARRIRELEAQLAATGPQPVAVRVKPLVWGQEGKQPTHAVSIAGTYLIVKDFDGWRWMRVVGGNLADICQLPLPTPAAAKVTAQADYAARILSAIEAVPAAAVRDAALDEAARTCDDAAAEAKEDAGTGWASSSYLRSVAAAIRALKGGAK